MLMPLCFLQIATNINVNANGGTIHRDIRADQLIATNDEWISVFHADACTVIATDQIAKNAADSPVGRSTATINVNTSAALTGSWTAKAAKELGNPGYPDVQNYHRDISANNYDWDNAHFQLGKNRKINTFTVTFSEKANIVKDDATSVPEMRRIQ